MPLAFEFGLTGFGTGTKIMLSTEDVSLRCA